MIRKLIPTLAVASFAAVMIAHASDQPLCQLTMAVNPDGGTSPQASSLNSCAPVNQDGGYGLSGALCKGVGPRQTLAFQSTRSGYVQLGDAGLVASSTKSRHLCAQGTSAGGPDCVALEPVGSGEVCISWAPDLDADGGFAASQTLRVFNETSAPSFTDNGFNPSSR